MKAAGRLELGESEVPALHSCTPCLELGAADLILILMSCVNSLGTSDSPLRLLLRRDSVTRERKH